MKAPELPPPHIARDYPDAFMVYASGGKLQAPRHLTWLGEKLRDLESGKIRRLVVSCPPRHGKTVMLGQYTPAWWLGRHPEHRIIYVTMQETFSRKQGRRARDILREHGPDLFGVAPLPRANTGDWEVYGHDELPTGGGMFSVGAGGTIVGKGANLLIIDDLIRSAQEAQNAGLREQQWDWFQSACVTRIEPNGCAIILMTRWNHDDLIGRLKRAQAQGEIGEPWTFVDLPALAEENDPLGRAEGEALWPERYDVKALKVRGRDVGPYTWETQYQCRPTPKGGAVLKSTWFKYYDLVGSGLQVDGKGVCSRDGLYRFASVDLAATLKSRADWTVMCVWGYHPEWKLLFLLDVIRERLEGPDILRLFVRAQAQMGVKHIFCERAGALLDDKLGSLVHDAQARGLAVTPLPVVGDKLTRAYSASGPFASGQVWFQRGAKWLPMLEEELVTFPDTAHDDQVDAVCHGVAAFQDMVLSAAPPPGQQSGPRERVRDLPPWEKPYIEPGTQEDWFGR